MIRRLLFSVAAIAIVAVVSAPVLAGGGGSKGNVPVRIKNVGASVVGVNAISGAASQNQLLAGARAVATNGVAQFNVSKGAFTAVAADPNNPLVTNKVRSFNTRNFKTIYLYAQQDTTAATLTGAPGGVKF